MEKQLNAAAGRHVVKAAVSGALMVGILGVVGIGSLSTSKATIIPSVPAEAQIPDTQTKPSIRSVDLSVAMEERTKLLKHAVVVHFLGANGVEATTRTIALADHPSWVVFDVHEDGAAGAIVDIERIRQHLISYPVEHISVPKACSIVSEWGDGQVTRAQTTCIAQAGYAYDVPTLALTVKEALEKGNADAKFALRSVPATILASGNSGSLIAETLTLLSSGHSDFQGSGVGRKANVRKAINERVNNVVIPKDADFSFNSMLGTVSLGNGWALALTIFDGWDLRPAPGGGICQSSTTVYRAVLNAGLPILTQKNHSLFVHYYEAYGVGLDSTVFPGQQDLRFKNDTGGPILVQAYTQGDEAFVNIYGIDDHRTVTMSGPYFAGGTAPSDILDNGKALRANSIAWKREVTYSTGVRKQEILVSKYTAIPRSLPKKAQPTVTQVRGTDDTVAVRATVADIR